jgi:hypothetical protein
MTKPISKNRVITMNMENVYSVESYSNHLQVLESRDV